MRNSFNERLDHLVGQLVNMSQLAAIAMRDATDALLTCDLALAERVITDDRMVDLARSTCESDAHLLLALQAPVAGDLRLVITALHSAESLERMGDLAQHVAETVRRRYPRQVLPTVLRPRFEAMGALAVTLAETAADAIRTREPELTGYAAEADGELNDLHRSLFAVLDYQDWAHGVGSAVDAVQLSQYYERFGDHAVSIVRRSGFITTGTMSREAS
ncbi:phosphate signaling complex protein PhoU [Kibdelosporangium philippinense]|uniref:Phosphate-specific transport system accessory protein PhoU n=1 Tax=Kibdelosporangium philippinense TaxID=211113 RepID=A0ABS8Z9J6_9PSEU|nr:phosphate signaling complex protein PhoU [Kibdelosporangium philippinense]MCE7004561.1 phosphate signaling complex protein PhoU [Kibdelosporangium philippinense]